MPQRLYFRKETTSFIKQFNFLAWIIESRSSAGVVLGPLLFLLFINDITYDIQSFVRLFADDSSLIFSSINPLEVEDRLNLGLQVLDDWAKQWLVDFNPQKTEYMVISFQQNINQINLKFNSENLNQVDNHKHLGVTISSNGKWAEHINNIKRLNKYLSLEN
jgi:hypothetical protein